MRKFLLTFLLLVCMPQAAIATTTGFAFNLNMDDAYQQFTNIFGGFSPLIYAYVGLVLAMTMIGALLFMFKNFISNK